jgi:hypothetical protein
MRLGLLLGLCLAGCGVILEETAKPHEFWLKHAIRLDWQPPRGVLPHDPRTLGLAAPPRAIRLISGRRGGHR